MTTTFIRDGDIEGALRVFKKGCERGGIFREMKRREGYLKPSIQKKMKQAATKKRKLRRERRKEL